MPEIEHLVVEALSEYVSLPAAQNLVRRTLRKTGTRAEQLTEEGWLRFLRGPILDELRQLLPIKEPTGRLRRLLRSLEESNAQPAEAQETDPNQQLLARNTLILPKLHVNLDDTQERERLVNKLAREEGVSGVLLLGRNFQDSRLPGVEDLKPILNVIHGLLKKQKPYKLYYSVFREGQVLVRPLGPAILVLVSKRSANLGRLMHVLNRYETEGGQP